MCSSSLQQLRMDWLHFWIRWLRCWNNRNPACWIAVKTGWQAPLRQSLASPLPYLLFGCFYEWFHTTSMVGLYTRSQPHIAINIIVFRRGCGEDYSIYSIKLYKNVFHVCIPLTMSSHGHSYHILFMFYNLIISSFFYLFHL